MVSALVVSGHGGLTAWLMSKGIQIDPVIE